MTDRKTPPFRADHVGSLLRPERLKKARDDHAAGRLDAAGLRAVEDDCIREIVRMQEDIGLKGITDGEQRRNSWNSDFLTQIDGVATGEARYTTTFKTLEGKAVDRKPTMLRVTGKLRHSHGIQTEDFKFLKSVVKQTPKVTIPSPSMLHFRGGREGIDKDAYPDLDQFYADLATVYSEEVSDLAALGCRYLQLDDTNLAYLCDPALREQARSLGEDPNELPRTYSRLINESIRTRPGDMSICVHMCRGNFNSSWVAQGGYEPVAEIIFNEMAIDGFFMEYDDERSGDFAPLRFLPKGKTVILGLVTSKRAKLETADEVVKRIEEAAQYAPLDQLAISPQCGFSSTVEGNALTIDQQKAKLALVVEVAEKVWGGV